MMTEGLPLLCRAAVHFRGLREEKKWNGDRKVKSKHIHDTCCFPEVCLLLPMKGIKMLNLSFGPKVAGNGNASQCA